MEHKKVELTIEDRDHIKSLYADAHGKAIEAASIAARALGYTAKVNEIEFQDSDSVVRNDATEARRYRYRHLTPLGNRLYFVTDNGCGYYDFEAGVCVSAPCH